MERCLICESVDNGRVLPGELDMRWDWVIDGTSTNLLMMPLSLSSTLIESSGLICGINDGAREKIKTIEKDDAMQI